MRYSEAVGRGKRKWSSSRMIGITAGVGTMKFFVCAVSILAAAFAVWSLFLACSLTRPLPVLDDWDPVLTYYRYLDGNSGIEASMRQSGCPAYPLASR